MSLRQRKHVVSILIALISLGIWYGQQQNWFTTSDPVVIANPQSGEYSVSRFADGDTITVSIDGNDETIRFIGVDTPETHDPRKAVQCYGPAASAFTKNTVTAAGLKVRLATDSLSADRDKYNRLLRYVYLPDGTLLNETLIRNGYGFYYPYFHFTKSDDFAAAQKTAQAEHKGLWANCTPTRNDEGGYTSNDQT